MPLFLALDGAAEAVNCNLATQEDSVGAGLGKAEEGKEGGNFKAIHSSFWLQITVHKQVPG